MEVDTSKAETAYSIKNFISEFLRNELFPKLEMLFDDYNLNETIIRFNEININLSVNKWNNFEQIKYEINKQFENKLKLHIQPVVMGQKSVGISFKEDETDIRKISLRKNYEATFLYFLENGHLPWFGKEEHINEFTTLRSWNRNLKEVSFVERLKKLIFQDTTVFDRFIYQFSDEIVVAFFVKVNLKLKGHDKQLLNLLKKLEPKTKYLFLKLLFHISILGEANSTLKTLQIFYNEVSQRKINSKNIVEFVNLIHNILPKEVANDSQILEVIRIFDTEKELVSLLFEIDEFSKTKILPKENESVQKEKELSFFERESSGIAVQNAGLIVLHPFLKYFFVNTKIADNNGILIKGKLDLAVQSLYFLATGNENVFEGDLVFEKFICGVPLKRPIPKQSLLTDKIKAEVHVLLKEAIKNWAALKNTSPNGLRQMFIQRDGKLIQKENKYKLLVERKAQDILLEKLSWNISMVKLPWKKELIIVEW